MASAPAPPDLECSICTEHFKIPKLLPCLHLACRDCLLKWLTTKGDNAGCPLCREPIIPASRSGHGNLATRVDELITDTTVMAQVEVQTILQGPHTCKTCPTNQVAQWYCFQCSSKLCKTCKSEHQKFPVLKGHTIEDLSTLTAKQMAASYQSMCQHHPDKQVELYCSAHNQLVCMMCFATNHRSCDKVMSVADAATEKRRELGQQAERLRKKEAEVAKQLKIQATKDHFKDRRQKAKDIFDDIRQHLERRYQEVIDQIQAEEDASLTSLADHDKLRAALMSHAGTAERMVTSAGDVALLQVTEQLTSCLNDVESRGRTTGEVKAISGVTFDSKNVSAIKSAVSMLGHTVTTSAAAPTSPTDSVSIVATAATTTVTSTTTVTTTSTSTAATAAASPATTVPKPTGAALARVLKVGDRVKKVQGYSDYHDGGGPGTVTAVPSRLAALRGGDPCGKVDVKWDLTGREGWCWMGRNNAYQLELL